MLVVWSIGDNLSFCQELSNDPIAVRSLQGRGDASRARNGCGTVGRGRPLDVPHTTHILVCLVGAAPIVYTAMPKGVTQNRGVC